MNIAGKEITPRLMTWGERKSLRAHLGKVAGKYEKLGGEFEKAKTPEEYAEVLSQIVMQKFELQEALLAHVYAIPGEQLESLPAKEVTAAVVEFLEYNSDPEAEAEAKKVMPLLESVVL